MFTFSPELKLCLGRVVTHTPSEIRLEKLHRAVEGYLNDEEGIANGEEAEDGPVSIMLGDLPSDGSSKWRLVP